MADEFLSRRVEVTFVGRPPARQVAAAVGVSNVEIVDHRLTGASLPTIDLRPPSAVAGTPDTFPDPRGKQP